MGKLSPGLDILVLAPHPDDAEIACGGLVALWTRSGYAVGIADFTAGEMGTRGNAQTRALETAAASRVLGIAVRENFGFPDARVENTPEVRLQVAECIRRHAPVVVLAPYPEDRHPDHGRTGAIAREAAFLAGLEKLPIEGRPHRPALLLHYMLAWEFPPVLVVDVTPVWDRKLEALRCYKSQFFPDPDGPQTLLNQPDFLPRIEGRHRYFGGLVRATYGEPYWTKLPLKIQDPALLSSILRPIL